jgi:uncharacterized protein (DUF1501 family)
MLMTPNRRDFIRLGLGSTLFTCGPTIPLFLARSAKAIANGSSRDDNGRILVVVQLDGGNDGLNTVVPYADPEYRKHRPKLQIAAKTVLKINDHIGFHPALTGFAKLLEEKKLAVVQSVGYPNPNRSHFESMAAWHTAQMNPTADIPGWLARVMDQKFRAPGGDAPALHISSELLPQALYGSQRHVPSVSSLEQFRRRLGIPESPVATQQRGLLDALGNERRGKSNSLLRYVEDSTLITYTSSARLENALSGGKVTSTYPDYSVLGRRLRLVAQMIRAGLTTSMYYTQLDGFDTHANQQGTHQGLLQQVGESLKAFMDDLGKSGDDKRVLVLVFSEFGRRLAENASVGTDHGTAAPVFLLGGTVKPGVHGPQPNLQDLDDGDPKFAIDFRQVYASVLKDWLGCENTDVLGERFEPLALL